MPLRTHWVCLGCLEGFTLQDPFLSSSKGKKEQGGGWEPTFQDKYPDVGNICPLQSWTESDLKSQVNMSVYFRFDQEITS